MAEKLEKCPNCGKEVKPKGMSLHQRYHCTAKQDKPEKPEKKQSDRRQLCKCTKPTWALLSPQDKAHLYFMRQINPDTGKAYHKYCTKCEEVI